MPNTLRKIHFLCDERSLSLKAWQDFTALYGQASLADADVLVVLGGDGFMLHSLHKYYHLNKPFYGINFGRVGFLLNRYCLQGFMERLAISCTTTLYPLQMEALTFEGIVHKGLAINEVSLLRQTHQAAKIQVIIDGATRIPELVADGILLATPAGSTAYNLSIHGPILPIDSSLLALTPISPFRPRRWQGALLKNTSRVVFKIFDPLQRSVSATADDTEIRDVSQVLVYQNHVCPLQLLFDPHHQLEERIFLEQFQA